MKFLLLSLLFLMGAQQSVSADNSLLVQMAEQERDKMDEFFEFLIRNSDAGYVFLGRKPVCVDFCHSDLSISSGTIGQSSNVIFLSGIDCVRKYAQHFASKRFLISVREDPEHLGLFIIYVVNVKELERVFLQNKALFQYVLGPTIQFQDLLDVLTDENRDFFHFLKQDNVLIGTVLGFGAENALFHSRFEELSVAKNPPISPPFYRLGARVYDSTGVPMKTEMSKRPSVKCEDFETNALELFEISNRLRGSSDRLLDYQPQLYFSRLKDESQDLVSAYENDQLKIIEFLDSANFLENVVNLFTEKP